ncbi:MAG TPA: hypothetical protein VNZ86_11765 [Bacteroidia bacterium]|jgi:hypothetical protein|nr:hypothetical protein [Bacteroidia bacterium]
MADAEFRNTKHRIQKSQDHSFKFHFFILASVFCFLASPLFSQELFPTSEPASTMPKGVIGVRFQDEAYQEVNQIRNAATLRVMYGLFSRLTVMANFTETNHHSEDFPPGLAFHIHNGNQSIYSTGNFQRGLAYPYLFSGIDLYAKFRFLSLDGEQKHFRMAFYAEASDVNVAHDEAEPDLLEDTKGYGGGLILTTLYNHLAVSFTTGFIRPGKYEGYSPDLYGGPMIQTDLTYGKAWKYDLSFGYLLLPNHYHTYNELNLNLYLEFKGKTWTEASIVQYGFKNLPIQTPLLESGNYVDVFPGIQILLKSNTRIDLSVGLPLLNESYTHFYPVYALGIQHYFYHPNKKQDLVVP